MGGARRVGPLLKLIINQGLLYTLTSRSFNVKKLINTTFSPLMQARNSKSTARGIFKNAYQCFSVDSKPLLNINFPH